MLRQTQSLKLTQKLIPKILLRQSVLAIPTIQLENAIKKELEMNPMLEEGSESEPEDLQESPTLDAELESPTPVESDSAQENLAKESKDVSELDDIVPENNGDEKETKIEEEYNWEEYFENEAEEYNSYNNNASGEDNEWMGSDNIRVDNSSLSESLSLQLHLSELNEKMTFIGEEIIGCLNDEGYLMDDLEDIQKDLDEKKLGTKFENDEFTVEEISETLKSLQDKLDPPGIAARNLVECLVIQVRRSNKNENLKENCIKVLTDYFEDLRLKRYENISKNLEISMDDVAQIFEFLSKLNPRPGSVEITSESESYIVPDIIIRKVEEGFDVFLNERYTPSIRINRSYKNLYMNKRKSLDKQTKEFITNNFNRAKWFIDAINSRRETMMKVMYAILEKQKPFFENMGEGLRPMTEKEIAEDIKMDISTISRTVRGKYVETEFGIYELRALFTNFITGEDGEDISTKEVKKKLKAIIENEDGSNPYTDDELAKKMSEIGNGIARRTVAKYREAMNIPKAKLRRKIQQ
jgi:RNA polymerase sigma-54 factor